MIIAYVTGQNSYSLYCISSFDFLDTACEYKVGS